MSAGGGARLGGKVAVVTAAGQGVGRVIAERLRDEGAQAHVNDRRADLLATWSGASGVALDLLDEGAVRDYFGRLPRVDVLVHVASCAHPARVEGRRARSWRRPSTVSLEGAFNVLSAAIPRMSGIGGSIVMLATTASCIKGVPRPAASGAAKAGVVGLTKAIAADYLKLGIRCNAICPGNVDAPSARHRIDELFAQVDGERRSPDPCASRQASDRLSMADEVAELCAFLASDVASSVTGRALCVRGGLVT